MLITVLVVAFFVTVTTDYTSSAAYANGESAKQLGDSAVNVVMAQIKDATAGFVKNPTTGVLDTTQRLAWASQPGMLRTWNDSGGTDKVYKLYSSNNLTMTLAGAAYDPTKDPDQADFTSGAWQTEPSIYTDLNSPVLIRDDVNGTIVPDPTYRPTEKYIARAPIIDPNNLVDGSTFTPPITGLTYCADPTNHPSPDVEGFSVVKPSTYDSTKTLSPTNNPVPMPVRWMYVLRDGTLTAPEYVNSNATFDVPSQPVPSLQNPIVGRVAFWADDETSKVDVNTASEGIFWDTPVAASRDEMNLAANVPVQNEFQRVPGHPATTCLSSVLTNVPVDHVSTAPLTAPSSAYTTYTTNLKKIYDLAPRIEWGNSAAQPGYSATMQGSLGGTLPSRSYNYTFSPANGDIYGNPYGGGFLFVPIAITNDSDRLFANLDDLLFLPTGALRDLTLFSSKANPATTDATAKIAQSRFFLTARSEAPEVTLYNSPRVSLWPITWPNKSAHLANLGSSDPRYVSTVYPPDTTSLSVLTNFQIAPQERLLAFCGQLGINPNNTGSYPNSSGPYRYFFQRLSPDSPTIDFTSIQRNQDLLKKYLLPLTNLNIPGFGGSFATKYSTAGRDQILVEAFNAIRGTVNLETLVNGPPPNYGTNQGPYYDFAGVNYRAANSTSSTAPANQDTPAFQVAPISADLGSGSGTKQGVGLYPVIGEADLQFIATKRYDPLPRTPPTPVFATAPVGTAIPGQVGTATTPVGELAGGGQKMNNSRAATIANTNGADKWDPSSLMIPTKSQTTEMRMILHIQDYVPTPIAPSVSYWIKATQVSGGQFSVNGATINFPASTGNVVQMQFVNNYFGPPYVIREFIERNDPKMFEVGANPSRRDVKSTGNTAANNRWEFVSDPIPVNPDGTTFSFTGCVVEFDIYAVNPANQSTDPTSTSGNLVRKVQIDFSKISNTALPIPIAPRWIPNQIVTDASFTTTYNPIVTPALNPTNIKFQQLPLAQGATQTSYYVLDQGSPGNLEVAPPANTGSLGGYYLYQDEGFDTVKYTASEVQNSKSYISTEFYYRMVLGAGMKPTDITGCNASKFPVAMYPSAAANSYAQVFGPYDTIIAMAIDPKGPARGDPRVLAALPLIPASPSYYANACLNPVTGVQLASSNIIDNSHWPKPTEGWQRHSLDRNFRGRVANLTPIPGGYPRDTDTITVLSSAVSPTMASFGAPYNNEPVYGLGEPPTTTPSASGHPAAVGVIAYGRTAAINASDPIGDWTNNMGNFADGGTVWFPDQFYQRLDVGDQEATTTATQPAHVPYFNPAYGTAGIQNLAIGYFSPSRQVASGIGLFGTLPSTDASGNVQPWQTLLFCPNPAIGTGHPGFGAIGGTAADHLLLDFFWMPVVEPYAISEPMATAGKVNLNYQILPFSNIKRQTGLYATLKSTKVSAIPSSDPNAVPATSLMPDDYKSAYQMRTAHSTVYTRLPIDPVQTLQQFDTKFAGNDIFRSASQICEMFLVPQSPTGTTTYTLSNVTNLASGFWSTMQLTGDNSREAPYNEIYPRVTTKSNTFQVHYRVQVLKKRVSSDQTVWEENKDVVLSEYRGSTTLERFIDPNDPRLPDFATLSPTDPNAVIDKYYRFRIVSTKAFTP